MSSRFVVTTLNGMCIAQLAAWMTTPPIAALAETTPPDRPSPFAHQMQGRPTDTGVPHSTPSSAPAQPRNR